MKFVLASHNKGKLEEMQSILGELGVEVVSQSDVGLELEPEENGMTFAENARIKAQAVMEASGLAAIADDSGLCVDALQGGPGVYSARYGGEEMSYPEKIRMLLQTMQGQTRAPATLPAISPVASLTARCWTRRESVRVLWPLYPWERGALDSIPSFSCPI